MSSREYSVYMCVCVSDQSINVCMKQQNKIHYFVQYMLIKN
jgi:hypothetical protein